MDLLTRSQAKRGRGKAFVSYRDLAIRDLGSIYEGLLEYSLKTAEKDLLPLAEAKKQGKRIKEDEIIKAEALYLVTDKGERKATGSYYTPDYIVKYIVENTLGPVIKEKKRLALDLAKQRKPEIEGLKRSLAGYKARVTKGNGSRKLYEQRIREGQARLARLQEETDPASILIDEILKIKVLDPAMGSGHFLVEATDSLARALVDALSGTAFTKDLKAEGVKETPPPYSEKEFDEDDIRWARREVIEKCIYGVDLNPLAVELAKLSLWLSTVAKDKPLSFLDHHLRCGNSLIGARIKDLASLPQLKRKRREQSSDQPREEQLVLFEQVFKEKVSLLLKDFEQIESLPSETVEQIKEKEKLYEGFRQRVHRFQDVADIWASVYFGNEVTWFDYQSLQEKLRATDEEWTRLNDRSWFKKGLEISTERRFFHWELEFPEVFFEGDREKKSPGFDAVIGNPPWGGFVTEIAKYLEFAYPKTTEDYKDIFKVFIERAITLLHTGGRHSFIVPNVLCFQPRYKDVRLFLLSVRINKLVNLGEHVFVDVEAPTCIYVVSRASPDDSKIELLDFAHRPREQLPAVLAQPTPVELPQKAYDTTVDHNFLFNYKPPRADEILVGDIMDCRDCGIKYQRVKVGLEEKGKNDLAERLFYQGLAKNPKDAFFINGSNVDRYFIDYSVQKHFVHNWKSKLRENEIVYFNADYFFVPEKIVWRQTADRIIACLETKQTWFANTLQVAVLRKEFQKNYRLLFCLALLNSRYLNSLYIRMTQEIGRTFAQVKLGKIRELPIRRINFTTLDRERTRLLEKGKKLYERCLAKGDQACVLGFVEHALKQIPEQADVVHDLLAFLAEQMIEMNKAKQAEVKGFLGWLEREVGAKIDDLKNKTKLKDYHESTFEGLLEVLKENRRFLTVDPSRREFQDRLEKEYNSSLAKLGPLKARIEATDRLIDQIVYKLYGLTEDEIALIESSAAA